MKKLLCKNFAGTIVNGWGRRNRRMERRSPLSKGHADARKAGKIIGRYWRPSGSGRSCLTSFALTLRMVRLTY